MITKKGEKNMWNKFNERFFDNKKKIWTCN